MVLPRFQLNLLNDLVFYKLPPKMLTESRGESKIGAYVGLKFASFLTRRVPPVGDTMGAMASPPLVQCV